MENETYTKDQVIEITMKALGNISVPVAFTDSIATPIRGAIKNLAVVLQMIEAEKNHNKEEAPSDESADDSE